MNALFFLWLSVGFGSQEPFADTVFCTSEYQPVCCKILEKSQTVSNRCVCTKQQNGTVLSEGSCLANRTAKQKHRLRRRPEVERQNPLNQ